MNIESNKGGYTMTPEEQKQHEEFLRRQRILQGPEGEDARRLLEQEMANKLTPKEVEESKKAAKEREETKPWGI